jgi:hypothetical protein
MKADDLPRIEPYSGTEDLKTFQNFLEQDSEEVVEELNKWHDRGLVISIDRNPIFEDDETSVECSSCEQEITEDVIALVKLDWMPTPDINPVLCLKCIENLHTEDVRPEIVMKNTLAEELQEHPRVSKSLEEEIKTLEEESKE